MSAEVVNLRPSDDPDIVLREAIGNMDSVLILGYDKDGEMYAASDTSLIDGGALLWLVESFKANLLNMDFASD